VEVEELFRTSLIYQVVLQQLACEVVPILARVSLGGSHHGCTDGGIIVGDLRAVAAFFQKMIQPQLIDGSLDYCSAETSRVHRSVASTPT